MFDFIRTRKRFMIFILALLLIPGMVFFGANGLIKSLDHSELVVKVGKEVVTKKKLELLLDENIKEIKGNLGKDFEYDEENITGVRQFLLAKIVDDLILTNEVRKRRLSVPDSVVAMTIKSLPIFSNLNKNNGFDLDAYRTILARQGIKPKDFDEEIRLFLAKKLLATSLTSSSMQSRILVESLAERMTSKYKIQNILFPIDKFKPREIASDEVLHSFYLKNQLFFQRSERATIEYLVLDKNKSNDIKFSDKELYDYYLNHIDHYTIPKAVRASHILIKSDPKSNGKDKEIAKEKAKYLLEEIRLDPSKFSLLAKQKSDDLTSAKDGGDLGYFHEGTMIKNFEKVAFSLEENEISNLVESDFGYHIIHLTAIRPAKIRSFKEVEDSVRRSVMKKSGQEYFLKTKTIFSQSLRDEWNDLEKLSKETGLKILRASINATDHSDLDNKTSQDEDGILENKKLKKAIFDFSPSSDDKNKIIILPVSDEVVVAARLVERMSSYIPSYNEIVDQVKINWLNEESKKLADKKSNAVLNSLYKNLNQEHLYPFNTPTDVVLYGSNLSNEQKLAIASVDIMELKNGPIYLRVKNSNGDFEIIRILSCSPDVASKTSAILNIEKQLKVALAQAELDAFLGDCKRNASVKYYQH